MARIARIIGALAVAAAAVTGADAAEPAAKPITLELKLPAKPAFPKPEMAAALTAGPITLQVTDARAGGDPAVVGGQRAKGEDLYVWRAAKPVVPAVQEFVTRILSGWSVRVQPEAELGLKLELTTYYVNEKSEMFGSTYAADVGLRVALTDRAGTVLWAGEAAGDAKRSGIDGRASICNEALSMALRAALANALAGAKLEAAHPEGKAQRAAAPAPPPATITIEPDALFTDLQRLKTSGLADDVLVDYVLQRRLTRPLSVDDILRWKNAGFPDAAIKAATRP